MNITEIKIYPFEPGTLQPDLKAYAEILLENCLRIKGIKVFQKSNGAIFIGFPAIALREGEYRDVVVPETPELKKSIRDRVVEAFKNEML